MASLFDFLGEAIVIFAVKGRSLITFSEVTIVILGVVEGRSLIDFGGEAI